MKTPQNPPFPTQLEEVLESNEFQAVKQLVRRKPFWKSKNQEVFWQSALPETWALDLVKLPEYAALLIAYFEQRELTNERFLRKAFEYEPVRMMRGVKLSAAYRSDLHWESLQFLRSSFNTGLKVFYKELAYLRRAEAHWYEKAEFYEGVLQATPFSTLLIESVAYFEGVKRDAQMISNNALQTRKEVALCKVLDKMLTVKRSMFFGSVRDEQRSLTALQAYAYKALPPEKSARDLVTLTDNPNENLERTVQLIRETIDFYLQWQSFEFQIDQYLCGYLDFQEIDDLEVVLSTNQNYVTQYRNDQKAQWSIMLEFSESLSETAAQNNRVSVSRLQVELGILEKGATFFALPEEFVSNSGNNIKLRLLFKVLRGLSLKRGNQAAHHAARYIYLSTKTDLIAYIVKELEISTQEAATHIAFLTTDLGSDDQLSVNIQTRPFLKTGQHYFWLSSLMLHRRWDTIMYQRIVDEKIKGDHKRQAEEIEAALAERFRRAGFRAVASWENPALNGEVDVLAFRDNTLFVVEVKSTVPSEVSLRHGWYQAMRFEAKAFLQLTNAIEFIQENFAQIRAEAQLGINCALEELRIVPLIVSNVFESDDIYIQDEYRKLSLFELKVILENRLYDVLHSRLGSYLPGKLGDRYAADVLAHSNQANPHIKSPSRLEPLSQEYCNLWSSPDACSAGDLLRAIDERRVWQGLDEIVDLKPGQKSLLSVFDPEVTFLNHPG